MAFYLDVHQVSSIDQIRQEQNIVVYPNPVREELQITTKDRVIDRLDILDLAGHLLLQGSGDRINVSALSAGTYLLKARSDKGTSITKFIKK